MKGKKEKEEKEKELIREGKDVPVRHIKTAKMQFHRGLQSPVADVLHRKETGWTRLMI